MLLAQINMFLRKDLIENSNVDIGGGTSVLKILYNIGIGQYFWKIRIQNTFCQTILSRIVNLRKCDFLHFPGKILQKIFCFRKFIQAFCSEKTEGGLLISLMNFLPPLLPLLQVINFANIDRGGGTRGGRGGTGPPRNLKWGAPPPQKI